MSRLLAVIPARGGSKGIPHKNLRLLMGKPLIVYTIQQALESCSIDRVIVTTDDLEIAKVSKSAGAEVLFPRPPELATDTARSIDVVRNALNQIEAVDKVKWEQLVMLQPTCPFRSAEDIDHASLILKEYDCDSVISVCGVGGMHPARAKYIDESGYLKDPVFAEEIENQNRQELPPMYIRNGAIYMSTRKTILRGTFKGFRSRPLVMPAERSVNIDEPLDLQFAEYLMSLRIH